MTPRRVVLAFVATWALVLVAVPASADYQCGDKKDDCKCGGNNPYPCCDNGSNCTWWAWESACCNWGVALPGWGNANTWGKYASQNGNYEVHGNPIVGSIATSTKGKYGHVAWVIGVNGGSVTVSEMNCCPTCNYGVRTATYNSSYFNSGYVTKKGYNPGPVCGNGKCEGGENCSNCSQDCGSCCGNGACDNGENCASCSKDCGSCCGNGACDNGESCGSCPNDCKCQPVGGLDVANCGVVSGWTEDPDNTGAALAVKLHSGAQEVATLTANGPHPSHGGHGFAWIVPQGLKDGSPKVMTAMALDSQTGAPQPLGQRSFLCANATITKGIWTVQLVDSAGLEALLWALDPPDLSLRLDHPAGYPYPVAGQIEACTAPLDGPFDALVAKARCDLLGAPFKGELRVDGVAVRAWGPEKGEEDLVLGGGAAVCLRAEATEMKDAPGAASLALEHVRVRSGAWWSTYATDAAGLLLGHPAGDALRWARRGKGPEPTPCKGWLLAWHEFDVPFDMVTWRLEGSAPLPAGLGVLLRVDGETWPSGLGAQSVGGLLGTRLGFEMGVEGSAALPPGGAWTVADIRVKRNDAAEVGVWMLARHGAWGLSGLVPPPPVGAKPGLHVRLDHASAGWWSTGTVSAETTLQGPAFERVRLLLDKGVTDARIRLRIAADGQPVWTSLTPSVTLEPLDVPARGNTLSLALGLAEDASDVTDAHAEFARIELLRQGWWSAPSADVAGLRDLPLDDGGLRVENARAWGLLGKPAHGTAHAHREFAAVRHGVRFHYAQDFDGTALRAMVLLDGQPAQLFEDSGILEQDVQVLSDFTSLGVALGAKGSGVYPYRWYAELTQIEVLGEGGVWEKVTVPQAGTASGTEGTLGSGGGNAGPDAGTSLVNLPAADAGATGGPGAQDTGSATAGCQTRGTTASPGASVLLLCAAAWVLRRQRGCEP